MFIDVATLILGVLTLAAGGVAAYYAKRSDYTSQRALNISRTSLSIAEDSAQRGSLRWVFSGLVQAKEVHDGHVGCMASAAMLTNDGRMPLTVTGFSTDEGTDLDFESSTIVDLPETGHRNSRSQPFTISPSESVAVAVIVQGNTAPTYSCIMVHLSDMSKVRPAIPLSAAGVSVQEPPAGLDKAFKEWLGGLSC